MKIYLYYKKRIHVFYLPVNISGSFSFDVDENETSKLINVDARNSEWVLFETSNCKIFDGVSYSKECVLEKEKFYIIVRNNVNYLIYVTGSEDENVNVYNYGDNLNICVGLEGSTASYSCSAVKEMSFKIASTPNGVLLNVVKGNIFVNKNRLNLNNYYIKNGDEVELFGVRLLFLYKMIVVVAPTHIFNVNIQNAGMMLANVRTNHNFDNQELKDKNLFTEDDYFSKSPRLRRIIENKKIEIASPPEFEKEKTMPAFLTIGPMLTMGVSTVVMASTSIVQVASGAVDLKDAFAGILTTAVMLISTLVWPLVTNAYTKKMKKQAIAESTTKYKKYLAEKKVELETESNLEREIIKENVISVENCLENLKNRKLNFWDKRMDQNDFLVARLGIGNAPLRAEISYNGDGFSLNEDTLKSEAAKVVNDYRYISDVPVGYSFSENIITAIMGESQKCHYFVNNILLQLLTFYSYDELKLAVFTSEKNENYWDYVRYLNHNMTNDNAFRYFASNEESANNVIDVLRQEINSRVNQLSTDKKDNVCFKPHYLLIVDDIDLLKKSNLLDDITELRSSIGFSIIILDSGISKLPSLCNNFIHIGDTTSEVLQNSYDKQQQVIFKDEINYRIDMMEIAKALANIPIEVSSGGNDYGDLPDAITFLEMAKVGKVEQLNIMNRWNTNDSTANLKAEVGVGTDGKLMYLDLHEKAHGPHGLVAGMTGSGKSEFIITWILSLCMNFSPEDVAFILIDYKGGGLAFAFDNQSTGKLPHLTGTITNLDKAEINRTLISIDSEVKRRQRIFNEARDILGESTIDIYKYHSFFHDGKLTEPLPHLFIVCDEFAELKAQQPDFMDNLISVARIGRSLGVHLILATQKPSGVVNDQIWSNTKFRVCLKVQDASDSNEMLKRPDAASLKQTGRFFLQVGYDEYFALGQSGWCGAKYYPSDVIQKSVDKNISILNENGLSVKTIQAGGGETKKVEAEGEQLAAIMKEIIKVAEQTNKFAKKLWLDNIPEIITIDGTMKKYNFDPKANKYKFVIGEFDAPESQSQAPLIYDMLTDASTNVIGVDSRENEAVVTTVLYGIMKNYLPNEITFYVVDYGSQNFMKYERVPHCGGVAGPGDGEKLNNLIKLLNENKNARKKVLSSAGREYVDYIKEHPGEMPLMFVVFNNYESIFEANEALYDIFGELLRDSERYGIVFFVTSSSPSAVPEKYKQLMPYTLALKLKDPSDYGYLFGGKGKIEPKDLFGRGICFNEILHEFQTASICEDKLKEADVLLELFDNLSKGNLPSAIRIPSLPEQVLLEDVSSRLKGLKKMPVGIEKGTLDIKTFNMFTEVGKVVLTNKLKYTKFFVNSFIDEVLALKQNLIVFDPANSLVSMQEKITNYVSKDFDAKIDQVLSFIEKNANSEKSTVLIINSLSRLLGKLEDQYKINSFFEKINVTGNACVLIVDEASKLRDYTYEQWFKYIDVSEGLYIGAGIEEQSVLKITAYGRELSEALPKNYGFYVCEGNFYICKIIEFERMVENEDDEE